MTSDIFNLENLSDIPQGMRKDLKCYSRKPFDRNLINLFDKACRALSIDEVTVGYYRVYGETKERAQVMAKLYNMSRSKSPSIKGIGIVRFKA